MSLKERLPSILPLFREDSELRVIVESLQAEIDELQTDTAEVKDSLFVETAEGQSLDLIGEELSIIGRRRGRNDENYRQLLQRLVPAFDGRGTTSDVVFAVAAGVTFDTDTVTLREDFGNRAYEVELLESDWAPHQTGTTRELAELADPVAVDRVDPVYLFSEAANPRIQAGNTESGVETVSEDGEIRPAGAGTQSEIAAIGLSSDDLEPLSTRGPGVSGQNTAEAEALNYDLSQRGVITELRDTAASTTYSFTVDTTTPTDFVVETRGGSTDFTAVSDFAQTSGFSSGLEAPQVVDIRIRNTATASGSTDAILGADDA
jgi:hypothetical protein